MKNIRIFALAKELGMPSKKLIEVCNNAGLKLSNALASVSPEERDTVVAFIKGGGAAEPAVEEAPAAPIQEESLQTSRPIRAIETPSRPTRAKSAPPPMSVGTATLDPEEDEDAADEPAEEVAAEDTVAEVEDDATEEAVAEEIVAEDSAEAEAEEDTETESEESAEVEAEEETVPEEAEEEVAAEEAEEAVAEEQSTDDDEANDQKDEPPEAVKPEDYVAPTGAGSGSRPIREMEMKPRGTVREPKKKQKKAAPTFSHMAAIPNAPIKPKQKAKKDEPAQKPEIRVADMVGSGGSLRDRVKEHMEHKETGKGKGRKTDLHSRRQRELESERERRESNRRGGRRRGGDMRRPSRVGRKRRRQDIVYKDAAEVDVPISVRSLSEAMGRPSKDLLSVLFEKGEMARINDMISEETAMEIAMELGVDLTVKRGRDIEEELAAKLEGNEEEVSEGVERPPVITILGHVDHGKTTLLDTIRKANVAAGEAGGITQHIAAYQVEHDGKKLTFVDTPGHAAFGEMRARGANVTDIVVLVVAADDGVMPQTKECISHAKAAGVPIIVAMNKTDLPDTDEQRVLQELAGEEILAAEWGGDIEVVRTSALKGDGVDDLLETLLLTAELQEYKADPEARAVGACVEAFRDEGRGVIAWLLVQKGTLRVGDAVLCGPSYGRIRAMYNDRDEEITEAGPSTPIKVTGLNEVPGAGDHFFVMADIEEARTTAESREHVGRTEQLAGTGRPQTIVDILAKAQGQGVKDLPLILKADTPGSLEALRGEITKFEHPEVRVKLVHQSVGGVNESDVSLANVSGAVIIAFHVVPEDLAAAEADRLGVEIRRYEIIYEITDHIKQALEGLLAPERVQETTGRALVLQTFKITRYGAIAGCRILSGTIERNHRVHVIRDQKIVGDYDIASLRREKDDVKEVREGMECGIRLANFNDVKEGDLMEAFKIREVKRTLE